ncbi:MAG TPA: alanyl-tRNA editing protein, partial [Gemmatimonadales bacterium]|nr:alanyl-tRNA editing protein [Gemmatimonadales bacterium]
MTTRLYYDSDDLSFDAIALAHDGDASRVVLDCTAFYPTSGGQPHDTGMLGDARVIDVIDGGERIIHVLDTPIPLGPVHGEVDPARREDFTVQHTAQHLVSALAADQLGWNTESVHFGATHSTIEFDTAAAGEEQIRSLEEWSSVAIGAALEVSAAMEDAATASGLRKPTDRSGAIRIVTIDGLRQEAMVNPAAE